MSQLYREPLRERAASLVRELRQVRDRGATARRVQRAPTVEGTEVSTYRDLRPLDAHFLFEHAAHQARTHQEECAVEAARTLVSCARNGEAAWVEADAAVTEMERLLAMPAPVVAAVWDEEELEAAE